MQPQVDLTALITLLAVASVPLPPNLLTPLSVPQVLAQTQDARKAEADELFQRGEQQLNSGQPAAALQSLQQALLIYQELKKRLEEGQTLKSIGNAYYFLQNYPQAIAYQQQALEIAREIKNSDLETRTLNNLGLATAELGDSAKAITYYQQSLALVRKGGSREVEYKALGSLGIAYFSLGQYQEAVKYHQQSLDIARATKNHSIKDRLGEWTALGNLGLAYNSLGQYQEAIKYYQQSLDIDRAIKDPRGEWTALGGLGLAYNSLGQYQEAIKYHQQSLDIDRAIKDRLGEGSVLNNLGLGLQKSGKLIEAERNLRAGIQIWETLRAGLGSNDTNKVSIFEEQARTYRLLQEVLVAQKKIEPALEIAERGRARAFVELLTSRLNASSAAQVTTNPPTLQQIKQIAKAQNATLVQYSIIYDNFKIQNKQELHESELFIWVIKPTGEVAFQKADLKPLRQKQNISLEALVTSSRESIGVGGRGSIKVAFAPGAGQAEQLQQLHKLLIEPISDLLPTDPNARIVFAPQGSLFLVPFPALQDAFGKYLIEKHTILTTPSIQVLQLTHQQGQKAKQAAGQDRLVVGNPTMPRVTVKVGEPPEQLSDLPGAKQEAIDIAKLLNTQALTGSQATKASVMPQLPKARLIHLATHGLLDDFKGLGVPGAIALAPAGKDDGLLTASEILDLKLKAELVVLSACDTGRGRITGDGVVGLSRSLISAGVPSVVVSLWSIPDAPTADLMTEFYRNFQEGKLDKAQALRQAMLKTMEQHRDPRDWAAFTLIGEAE